MILGCAAFAHRGLWSPDGAPENSIAAFRAAAEAGCGIELDVQLSSDGVPVVFHDPMLDRMTAASGPVWHRTAEELAELELGASGERIPALAQVLAALPSGTPVLVELKASPGEAGDYLRALDLALFGAKAECAVMSFVAPLNRAAHAQMPARTRGVLIVPANDEAMRVDPARYGGAADLGAAYTAIWHSDAPFARKALGEDAWLAAWTVDSAEALASATGAGAAVIFEHLDPAVVRVAAMP